MVVAEGEVGWRLVDWWLASWEMGRRLAEVANCSGNRMVTSNLVLATGAAGRDCLWA